MMSEQLFKSYICFSKYGVTEKLTNFRFLLKILEFISWSDTGFQREDANNGDDTRQSKEKEKSPGIELEEEEEAPPAEFTAWKVCFLQ